MSATTKIEWTDATWNPVTGCTPCSPGCEHCYAKRMAARFPQVHGGEFETILTHPDRMDQPLHWRKPRRVFVCSMGDLFHELMGRDDIAAVYRMMALCPQHTFLVLTKRIHIANTVLTDWAHSRMRREGTAAPLPNVWLGVTVCNQAEADAKIPVLLATPAALRFVSIEPMLGPVALNRALPDAQSRGNGDAYLDWVICGGETGPGAREMRVEWARALRNQCVAAAVPFFFKGWGIKLAPKTHPAYRQMGGREWNDIPGGVA